jgi:uncharacterized membrane protein
MKNSNRKIVSVLTGAVVLGCTIATPAFAAGDDEKCAGIVKAGKNAQKDAWIYVPKGTCEKIAGGTVVKK